MGVCRECLAGDSVPYIRRDWTLGWATIAPRSPCGIGPPVSTMSALSYTCRSLRIKDNSILGCVAVADFQLTHGESRPAHEAAIRLHRRLIQSHQCGFFNLVGYGEMRWAAILGVSSALISIVFEGLHGDRRRRRLFNDVARDLGLAARYRTAGDNYHGLLLVAWTMDDWPKRSRAIARGTGIGVDRLRTIRIGGRFDTETRGAIEDVLASAWSGRPLALRRRTNAGARNGTDVECKHGRGQDPLDAEYLSQAKALLRFFRKREFQLRRRAGSCAASAAEQAVLEADRGQIANRQAYVYRIAANEANGIKRSRRIAGRFQSALAVLYGTTVERRPVREINGREVIGRLVEAVFRLPPRARATWLAARVANRPQADIASEAGCEDDMLLKRRSAGQTVASGQNSPRNSIWQPGMLVRLFGNQSSHFGTGLGFRHGSPVV